MTVLTNQNTLQCASMCRDQEPGVRGVEGSGLWDVCDATLGSEPRLLLELGEERGQECVQAAHPPAVTEVTNQKTKTK